MHGYLDSKGPGGHLFPFLHPKISLGKLSPLTSAQLQLGIALCCLEMLQAPPPPEGLLFPKALRGIH